MSKQLTQEQIDYNTTLLVEASDKGCLENVKKLLPISNPKAQNSQAFRWAAMNGHTECVKQLLPYSNPEANNQAFMQSALSQQIEMVKLLLPFSDYLKAEQEMKDNLVDTTFLRQHIDEHEALLQKERLTEELKNNTDNNHCSPKRKI